MRHHVLSDAEIANAAANFENRSVRRRLQHGDCSCSEPRASRLQTRHSRERTSGELHQEEKQNLQTQSDGHG